MSTRDTMMTPVWSATYFVWLAYCLAAYASDTFASPLGAWLVTPMTVWLAAAVGVALGWRQFRQRGWLPTRAWTASTWISVAATLVWLALAALDVRGGKLGSVFGMFIMLLLALEHAMRPVTTE